MSVDRAAGFIVTGLLGPGVEEVAGLPRRVVGAAKGHANLKLKAEYGGLEWRTLSTAVKGLVDVCGEETREGS